MLITIEQDTYREVVTIKSSIAGFWLVQALPFDREAAIREGTALRKLQEIMRGYKEKLN